MQLNHINNFLVCAGIFILVTLVFGLSVQYEFINFDDNIYITENQNINTGLTKENIIWAFSRFHGGHWHPLSWLSHMLDCELFGISPEYHRAENILMHSVNCMLLFWFFSLLGKSDSRFSFKSNLLIVLVFAIHPLRLESVVWVTERKDVLSVLFGLLSLITYIKYAVGQGIKLYFLSVLFLMLGLLSKPMLVTWPFLMLALDCWPLSRFKSAGIKNLIVEKIPFFVLIIISSVISFFSQSAANTMQAMNELSLTDRLSGSFIAYFVYVGKLFAPFKLAIFYPYQVQEFAAGFGALLAWIILVSLAFKHREEKPYVLFGMFWFLFSLIPVIGLVQIGGQAYSDRWTYIPHIGLLILCGLMLQELMVKYNSEKYFIPISVIIIFGFSLLTWLNLPYWQNSEVLFRHALEVTRNNFMAHTNLGVALERKGILPEAFYHYKEAARINPFYPEALNNSGIVEARAGRLTAAQDLFKRALERKPDYPSAKYNLGLSYSDSGQSLHAINEWLNLLTSYPGYADARNSLNIVLQRSEVQYCVSKSPLSPGEIQSNITSALEASLMQFKKFQPDDTATIKMVKRILNCTG